MRKFNVQDFNDPTQINRTNEYFQSGTYIPVITGMTVTTGTLATVNILGSWQKVGTFCMISFDIFSDIGQNIQLANNWTASLPLSIKRTSIVKNNQTEGRQLAPFLESRGTVGFANQSTTQDFISFPIGVAGRSRYTITGIYLAQ